MLAHKLTAFALVVLALSQVDSQAPIVTQCKSGFALVTGKCLLSVNSYVNWYDADRHCRSLGAGLVAVQNQSTLQQVTNWILSVAPINLDFWTSGNSFGKKGTYWWQNTGERATYLPWGSGEPRTAVGDCLTFYRPNTSQRTYTLGIRNCTTAMQPYICEQTPQRTSTRLCLNPSAYENATVLVN